MRHRLYSEAVCALLMYNTTAKAARVREPASCDEITETVESVVIIATYLNYKYTADTTVRWLGLQRFNLIASISLINSYDALYIQKRHEN